MPLILGETVLSTSQIYGLGIKIMSNYSYSLHTSRVKALKT